VLLQTGGSRVTARRHLHRWVAYIRASFQIGIFDLMNLGKGSVGRAHSFWFE
jgi:hypothetical protein